MVIFKGIIKTPLLVLLICLGACNKDPDTISPLTGITKTYELMSAGTSSGSVEFAKRSDNSTQITITVVGTSGTHPAFLNSGTAAGSEGIEFVLSDVENGESITDVATLNDGTIITYDDLISYDGNISIHQSASDLGTIILNADIGINELTGADEVYTILNGSIEPMALLTISKRVSGSSLATVTLNEGGDGTAHPIHIHDLSAVENGSIVISLADLDPGSGSSLTNIEMLDNETSVSYDELINLSAHVRIHESSTNFSNIIGTGDIGQNLLTGNQITYELPSTSSEEISGMATLYERKNGSTLVSIKMVGTSSGVNHNTHIHENNAIDGGSIVISFNSISGGAGNSNTNISQMDDGTSITYEQLLEFNGHIVIHPGPGQTSILAKGDIGQNELTGTFETYELESTNADNVSGTVYFRQRKNNTTVVEMELTGTTAGANHATHIHQNSVLTGGSIDISFKEVTGNTGISRSSIKATDNGTPITYDEMINYNGHVVVHPNASQTSIVAKGDIGQNIFTENFTTYTIDAVSGSSISGTVTFFERKSGLAMVQVEVTGTVGGNSHPNHIHENSVATGGSIVLNFNNIDGATGISKTDAVKFNVGTAVTYAELLLYNGHVIVHHETTFSPVAKGNIGSN